MRSIKVKRVLAVDGPALGRPRPADYLALFLLWLAKLGRKKLSVGPGSDSSNFYESFFVQKDLEAAELDPRMKTRRDTIIQYLTDRGPSGGTVLDVGCGLGELLAHLPRSYRLVGMDFARRNTIVTKNRLGGQGETLQGSALALPLKDDSIDVCFCMEVLEHLESDATAVSEVVRILKPSGLLITAVPYTYYWPQYLKLMGHYRHYSRESFTGLIEEGGLRVVAYLPNYPKWHQAYTRGFAFASAQSRIIGKIFGPRSLYEFRWPWQVKPTLTVLEERLQRIKMAEAEANYDLMGSSTLVAAIKR